MCLLIFSLQKKLFLYLALLNHILMKRILLLVPFVLFACSNGDDHLGDSDNPIVGKWRYNGIIEYPEEEETMESEASECSEKSTLYFKVNGNLEAVHYHSPLGDCVLNEMATTNLNWEQLSEGKYRISGENGSNVRDEIAFPDSNTMHMISNTNYNKLDVVIDRKAEVYKRIE